jgi:hypothetical protein
MLALMIAQRSYYKHQVFTSFLPVTCLMEIPQEPNPVKYKKYYTYASLQYTNIFKTCSYWQTSLQLINRVIEYEITYLLDTITLF